MATEQKKLADEEQASRKKILLVIVAAFIALAAAGYSGFRALNPQEEIIGSLDDPASYKKMTQP
ncbi:MAG: hypothetical protein H7Z41_15980 [Cytophagales bacterium]|nr:hypothetical protein [Armatimonadota bacterium]